MKKILALLLAISMIAVMVGCGSNNSGSEEPAAEPAAEEAGEEADAAADEEIIIGMCPKLMNDGYMIAAGEGAQEACDELGYTLDFNGPVSADIAEQTDIINQWTQKGYTAITISANDADSLSPAMEAAQNAGIYTSAWDADVNPDARDLFLNQATFEGISRALVDQLVAAGVTSGNVLVVTSTLTAPNQSAWLEEMENIFAAEYPDITVADVLPGNEDLAESRDLTYNYLNSHSDTAAVVGLSGNATPGCCEAIDSLGLADKVKCVGIAVPSTIGDYLKSGTCSAGVLWSPHDIGYCIIYMIKAQIEGTWEDMISKGKFECGSCGELEVTDKENGIVLLGDPTIFTADNVDNFNF